MAVSQSHLSKAERLAVGGAVAPGLRGSGQRSRRVVLIDGEGRPTGVTTSSVVARSLLARDGIEFGVRDERPRVVVCEDCAKVLAVPKTGAVPVRCASCKTATPWRVKLPPEAVRVLEQIAVEHSARLERELGVPVKLSAVYAARVVVSIAATGLVLTGQTAVELRRRAAEQGRTPAELAVDLIRSSG